MGVKPFFILQLGHGISVRLLSYACSWEVNMRERIVMITKWLLLPKCLANPQLDRYIAKTMNQLFWFDVRENELRASHVSRNWKIQGDSNKGLVKTFLCLFCGRYVQYFCSDISSCVKFCQRLRHLWEYFVLLTNTYITSPANPTKFGGRFTSVLSFWPVASQDRAIGIDNDYRPVGRGGGGGAMGTSAPPSTGYRGPLCCSKPSEQCEFSILLPFSFFLNSDILLDCKLHT